MICTIEKLSCKYKKQKERLLELQELGYQQSKEFKDEYPWTLNYKLYPHFIHYVAVANNVICGWAYVETNRYHGYKTVEVKSISTRQTPVGEQRIGRLLHTTMLDTVKKGYYDLLFLHAGSVDAYTTYKKWGYRPVFTEDEIKEIVKNSPHVKPHPMYTWYNNLKKNLENVLYYPTKENLVLNKKFKEMCKNDMIMLVEDGQYGEGRKKSRKTLKNKH